MNIKKLLSGFILICTIFININYSLSYANEPNNQKVGFYRVQNINMEYPYDGKGILLSNGKILYINGKNAELYNPQTDKFSVLSGHRALIFNGNLIELNNGEILIFGSDETYSRQKENIGKSYAPDKYIFEKFNPIDNTFSIAAEGYIQGLKPSSCILLNDGNVLFSSYEKLYVYDVYKNELSDPIEYSDNNFVHFKTEDTSLIKTENGNILIFGLGYYKKDDKNIPYSERKINFVFEYDIKTKKINKVGELTKNRIGQLYAFKIDKNNIIVLGGDIHLKNSEYKNTIEKYNIEKGTSEEICELPFSLDLGSDVILSKDNKIIFNTRGEKNRIGDKHKLYVYDITKNSLEYTKGNYIPLYKAKLINLKNKSIIYIGGFVSGHQSNRVYRYYY